EYGVRVALGALPRAVQRLALGEFAAVLGWGAALGLIATWLAGRALQAELGSLLFGLAPGDFATLAAATLLLVAISLAAAWLPARRSHAGAARGVAGGTAASRRLRANVAPGLSDMPARFLLLALICAWAGTAASAQASGGFDATSIKPYRPTGSIGQACSQRMDPKSLTLIGCTLQQLVVEAYDLKEYALENHAGRWVETDSYTLDASMSSATP